MDAKGLVDVEVRRLRELHDGGAITDEELRAGVEEALTAAGLASPATGAPEDEGQSKRIPKAALIAAFLVVDVGILIVFLAVFVGR